MFSLGWKTTFLEKKRVYEQTYLESRTEVRCKQKYRVTVAIYANSSQAFCPQRKRRKTKTFTFGSLP